MQAPPPAQAFNIASPGAVFARATTLTRRLQFTQLSTLRIPALDRCGRSFLSRAPGFRLENVWVLPGLPAEMEAMFDAHAAEFRAAHPIDAWRRTVTARESDIVELLVAATERWPRVRVGSYPRFDPTGPQVEVVLKSSDATALSEAVSWLEPRLLDAVAAVVPRG